MNTENQEDRLSKKAPATSLSIWDAIWTCIKVVSAIVTCLFLFVFIIVVKYLAFPSMSVEKQYNKIQIGWAREQVIQVMGKPDYEWTDKGGKSIGIKYYEELHPNAYIILLDNHGIVTKKHINHES